MINQDTAPYAALVLRLTLGVMFVAHALLKIREEFRCGHWTDALRFGPAALVPVRAEPTRVCQSAAPPPLIAFDSDGRAWHPGSQIFPHL